MTRIRTLKPEWLDDEKLSACSREARILSVALILLADDHGNGRSHPLFLAARVFPYGDAREGLANIENGLAELSRIGFVQLYNVQGQQYFHIRNWSKHQKVDHPGKPRVPEPSDPGAVLDSRDPRETLAPDPDLRPPTSDHDRDRSQGPAREVPAPLRPPASVAPIRPLTFEVSHAIWAEGWHQATGTTTSGAKSACDEELKRSIVDAALEVANGDHARALDLTRRAWAVGWADRWWEKKNQRVPLFKHFAERFSQYLAEVVQGGGAPGGEEYDDNGHLIFPDVPGESTADRKKRMAEHNRRVREESGG